MHQTEYIIAPAPCPPFQCEEEKPHDCSAELYEVKWAENDHGEIDTYYFVVCKDRLEAWAKTVDRAALMTYI